MKRKICAIFLTAIMLMTVVTQAAFADITDDLKNGPNTIAMITVENADCVELENIKDLEVRLSKPSAGINITIPVQNVEMDGEVMNIWLGAGKERVTDAVMKQLADIQGDINLGGYSEEPEDLIEDLGYVLEGFDVEIVGLPEDHYTYSASAFVLTNEIFKEMVDMVKELIGSEYGEFTTFKELIEAFMKEMGMSLDDFEPDLRESIQKLIDSIDPAIAYLTSEEFSGLLIFGADLSCLCPEIWRYQIQQRYYEYIDGKLTLIGTVNLGEYDSFNQDKYLEGELGQLIRGKDFIDTEYKGRTYKYIGSYDYFSIYGGAWKDDELESFRLGEDFSMGLVLRYVIGEKPAPAKEKSPDTGDESQLAMYIILLVGAVTAAGAMTVCAKKK